MFRRHYSYPIDFFHPVLLAKTRLQASAVELKLEQLAADAERHARRSSFSQSIQESKRRAEREAMPVAVNTYNGGRRRSRMKRRGRCVAVQCLPINSIAPLLLWVGAG